MSSSEVHFRTGHSIGGFDADKIQGTHLELGIGKAGEPFEGIGRGVLNIEGFHASGGGVELRLTGDNVRGLCHNVYKPHG